jgi:uncharacterized UPF0160 family protein
VSDLFLSIKKSMEIGQLRSRIKQLEANFKFLESTAWNQAIELDKRADRIKQLEQELAEKSEVTLMDVLWKENDQLQDDVEQLRATAATMDSLAKKAREVIDQFIDRTRELERLLAEKTSALRIHEMAEWPERIFELERLVEVKNEALTLFANRDDWLGYELLPWDQEEHPSEIAQKALEQE